MPASKCGNKDRNRKLPDMITPKCTDLDRALDLKYTYKYKYTRRTFLLNSVLDGIESMLNVLSGGFVAMRRMFLSLGHRVSSI